MWTIAFGMGFMGVTLGYVLFYAVRTIKTFDIALLASIAGIIFGGALPRWLFVNPTPDTTAPIYLLYGIGLIVGFIVYGLLAWRISKNAVEATKKFLAGTLLGYEA